ncbi:phytoene dehydrogenase-like protein [Anseongella ginsenosidimutans]|uniref:Phytoene dehydrogenase-like protein n=1 Tax=Anseongella ginsenosidimutans TaxID=496056 RepID=A0A4R3KPA3_9SPHI|nr:NAD(P)/FAD-dependent oxidoreductase [Anseongella ginsenosidimutans]QEC53759.1 NAD(P)/FAD-dependent oxidoreductase [Anseongella ginsenosidimutans]TCS85980.1 phytoene dehydrogenase-like protein [Anseongella ginsenosidimutans]
MSKTDFDAVIAGAGPNGLAAAIVLQQAGLSVLLLEARNTVGGGMRTEELTLPGFLHDVCSAVHPLAAISPFFKTLPLEQHGLKFIYPETAAAHPFDDGSAAFLHRHPGQTAAQFGTDAKTYLHLTGSLLRDWSFIENALLGPLRFPGHPLKMARFGLKGIQPAARIAGNFSSLKAKGFWAGMAAHSMQPLHHSLTSAIGLVLIAAGHLSGWPVARGGSGAIASALAAYFVSLGGKIETGFQVEKLSELPSSRAVLLDVGPQQLLRIAGHRFSSFYKWQLEKYRYGPGVFKIDWALDAPVPFKAQGCDRAGTLHLGNSFEEISAAEDLARKGKHAEKPFVLLAQQSLFDASRAPEGKHTAWAYCHVPNGSDKDMTQAIEQQVERFAPGFRERILARHVMNAAAMEGYNANYIGGDINGGAVLPGQLFTRPALRYSPYRTSAKGIYICSSSTPPGGGVHGMCGFHAASRALKDIFKINNKP